MITTVLCSMLLLFASVIVIDLPGMVSSGRRRKLQNKSKQLGPQLHKADQIVLRRR